MCTHHPRRIGLTNPNTSHTALKSSAYRTDSYSSGFSTIPLRPCPLISYLTRCKLLSKPGSENCLSNPSAVHDKPWMKTTAGLEESPADCAQMRVPSAEVTYWPSSAIAQWIWWVSSGSNKQAGRPHKLLCVGTCDHKVFRVCVCVCILTTYQ